MRIGLLCSGGLGLSALNYLYNSQDLSFVCTDKGSSAIIERCRFLDIPLFIGSPRKGNTESFVENKPIDVLISINYLFIIEDDLINLPRIIAFNIHGSLLPKYRGRTPHVWAIINNETTAGITAHVIDRGCDTGAIIEQIKVPINSDDTGNDVLEKYNSLYQPLVDSVLQKIQAGNIELTYQDERAASFFGKRTPADGMINWEWHRERIYNWVRAQANPYPGAFSFCNREKIVIDAVSFSDVGFSQEMPNGLVIETKPDILVKTPNGVLKLATVRSGIQYINSKDILSNE